MKTNKLQNYILETTKTIDDLTKQNVRLTIKNNKLLHEISKLKEQINYPKLNISIEDFSGDFGVDTQIIVGTNLPTIDLNLYATATIPYKETTQSLLKYTLEKLISEVAKKHFERSYKYWTKTDLYNLKKEIERITKND